MKTCFDFLTFTFLLLLFHFSKTTSRFFSGVDMPCVRMAGPLMLQLISTMGERRAYLHVERILELHAHSAKCFLGESAVMPHRHAEKQLLRRLREYVESCGLSLVISDVSNTPMSGDILVTSDTKRALWDSKHYKKPVPWSQVVKLARDVRVQEAAFGVVVAPHGVSKHKGMTQVICEGVPVHICEPKSREEFACLYLTDSFEHDGDVTQMYATFAHAQANLCKIQKLTTELVDTFTRG